MERKNIYGVQSLIVCLTTIGLAILPCSVQAQYKHESGSPAKSKSKGVISKAAIVSMPRLHEKGILTVSGDENWDEMTSFGKDSTMAEMMTLMMVGGSGMEHMKMGAMKPGMKMADKSMPGMNMSGMKMGGMPMAGNEKISTGVMVKVTLSPNPPAAGDNNIDVLVTDISGKPMTGLKLNATVAMTSMDMGTTRPKVVEGEDGHYSAAVNFSMKGPWRVTLTSESKSDKAKSFSSTLDFAVDGKTKWIQPVKAGVENTWKVVLNTRADALKVGKNILDITILDPMGMPVSGAIVNSAVEMASMDMGVTKPKTIEGKDGHYSTEAQFTMKGPWRVTLTITARKQKPFTKVMEFKVAE